MKPLGYIQRKERLKNKIDPCESQKCNTSKPQTFPLGNNDLKYIHNFYSPWSNNYIINKYVYTGIGCLTLFLIINGVLDQKAWFFTRGLNTEEIDLKMISGNFMG